MTFSVYHFISLSVVQVLAYGQSEYVRQFGMTVDEAAGPLNVAARVLAPPKLRYGQDSPQPVVVSL